MASEIGEPFDPAHVALTYKKTFLPPQVAVKVFLQYSDPWSARIGEKPAWARLITHDWDSETRIATYMISVDTEIASNLKEGDYSGTLVLIDENPWFGNSVARLHDLSISIKVVDTVRLSLSKSNFTFSHTIGDPLPDPQKLNILTENPWSINLGDPWLTTATEQGSGNQSIDLGVAVDGLAPGIYESTFIVNDGRDKIIGKVTLLITGSTEEDDYLNLSHTALTFSEKSGAVPTSAATVNISSSLPVDVTTQTPWLILSAASFPSGDNVVTVNVQNTETMAVGSYIGSFKVKSGFSAREVKVLLRIVEVLTSGINSNGFYYANDRNILFLSSATENSEALLDFSARTERNVRTYKKRVPFFENAVETVIGLETNNLLKPQTLPEFVSGLFKPIIPLVLDLQIYDKQINSTALSERSSFTNLSFINGKTPVVENQLTHIPKKVTTTSTGVVVFSFVNEDPIEKIDITGDVTHVIAVTKPSGKIFTAVVDLAPLNLSPQDKIRISCGSTHVDVVIKSSELPTFQLIWLNEWDCPEVMNLDGSIEIEEEDDSRIVSLSEAGKEISRIIDVKEPKSFRVSTGNIYSQEEVKWLSTILRSRKMWLEIAGDRVEVVKTFKRLNTFRTREFQRNYQLTFDAAVK